MFFVVQSIAITVKINNVRKYVYIRIFVKRNIFNASFWMEDLVTGLMQLSS